MRRFLVSFASAALLGVVPSLASDPASSDQIAVSGNSYACDEFEKLVVNPAVLDAELFAEAPIPTADFPKFRAVVFAERDEIAMRAGSQWTPEDLEAVENYVKSGGTLIFCRYGISTVLPDRSLGEWARVLGFSSYPDAKGAAEVELTSEGVAWLAKVSGKNSPPVEAPWVAGATPVAEGITSAEELAMLDSGDGSGAKPVITLNKIGKGRVFFLGTSLNALSRNQAKPEEWEGLASFLRAALTSSY